MKIRTLAAIAAAMFATSASAVTLSGTFTNDNDKASIVFLVGTGGSTVSLTSTGYAAGGFDPVFSLYKSGGQSVAFNDDWATKDSKLSLSLAAGYYELYVTQYNNFGPIDLNLADFPFDDVPDFRDGFVDSSGSKRTGFWSLDVLGAAAVPETGSLALLGLGVFGFAALRRKAA